jgi:hypothetical protein
MSTDHTTDQIAGFQAVSFVPLMPLSDAKAQKSLQADVGGRRAMEMEAEDN